MSAGRLLLGRAPRAQRSHHLVGAETLADQVSIETAERWVSLTARVRMLPAGEERSMIMIIHRADPFADGQTTVTITLDGLPYVSGVLQ